MPEISTKVKQETTQEPNKIDKTCRIGHDNPDCSVGPRSTRKGVRQPARSFGWGRRWAGFFFCCLAFAPASAAACPFLDETHSRLVALNRSPQGSLLLLSPAAMATDGAGEFEGCLGAYSSTFADNDACLQYDMNGCNPRLLFDVGVPTLIEPTAIRFHADVGLPTSASEELGEFIAEYGIPLFLCTETGLLLGWATGVVLLAWTVGGLLAYQQTKQTVTHALLYPPTVTSTTRKSLKRQLVKRRRLKARQTKQVRTKNLRLELALKAFLKQQYSGQACVVACRRLGLGRGKVQHVAGARLSCRRRANRRRLTRVKHRAQGFVPSPLLPPCKSEELDSPPEGAGDGSFFAPSSEAYLVVRAPWKAVCWVLLVLTLCLCVHGPILACQLQEWDPRRSCSSRPWRA